MHQNAISAVHAFLRNILLDPRHESACQAQLEATMAEVNA